MTAPERIWAEPAIAEKGNHGSTVWPNTDDGGDIEYVRADLYTAACAERDALKARADDFSALIADARTEAEKAMRKYPQPNYVISKFAEEAGEAVKAAIHCAEGRETPDNVRIEVKQSIAMLYRLWVEGDQVHGLPPLRGALQGDKP